MQKYNKILKNLGKTFLVGVVIIIIASIVGKFVYSEEDYISNVNDISRGNYQNSILVDNFDSVNIISSHARISFIPSNEFRVEYDLDYKVEVTICEVQDGTLNLKYETQEQFLGFDSKVQKGYIEIYYDESINNGELEEININTISSEIYFSKVNYVDKINVDIVSNDVLINTNFKDLTVNAVNGKVSINNVGDNVDKINIKSESGDVYINNQDDNVDIKFNTVTGKAYHNGQEFKKEYFGLKGEVDILIDTVYSDFYFNY